MKRALLLLFFLSLRPILRLLQPAGRRAKRLTCTARFLAHTGTMEPSTQCDGPIRVIGTGRISLGRGCRLGRECEFTTEESGEIILGDNIRINRGVTLTSYSRVSIGTFSIIGEFASIRDANHGMALGQPMRIQPHTSAPISIGKDVWIGRGSCILPGVTIGDGAIIGANSVVTRNVPPRTLVAGAPARVLRERGPASPTAPP